MRFSFLVLACFWGSFLVGQQADSLKKISSTTQKIELNENSVVYDSLGNQIPFAIWKDLLMSRKYLVKKQKLSNGEERLVLTSGSPVSMNRLISKARLDDPKISFLKGTQLPRIVERAITGEKIDSKALLGKILVINTWFINCSPCITEIPELNQLRAKFKDNPNIVFIGFALDEEADLKRFLKDRTFTYLQIPSSSYTMQRLRISSYPSHLIVDPAGKIIFHSTGYSPGLVEVIAEEIENLVLKQQLQPNQQIK